MSQERTKFIFSEMQKFLNGAEFLKLLKSKPKIAEKIIKVKAEDLVLGDMATAKFITGYFKGNVRSEGFKGDINRTLNFDFTTGEIGFIDDGNTADDNELYHAAHRLGVCMYDLGVAKYSHLEQLGKEVYRQDESELAQIRNLLPLCRKEHEKLGFILRPDTITILESEFIQEDSAEMLICPVYANITDNKGKASSFFLGYFSEMDGDCVFYIDVDDLIKKPKHGSGKTSDKGISWGKIIKWILIAGVAAVAVVYIIKLVNS